VLREARVLCRSPASAPFDNPPSHNPRRSRSPRERLCHYHLTRSVLQATFHWNFLSCSRMRKGRSFASCGSKCGASSNRLPDFAKEAGNLGTLANSTAVRMGGKISGRMRVLEAKPLADFRLFLRFEDGTAGDVDLSSYAGKGVFAAWLQSGTFDQATVTPAGAVEWPGDLDLCPDALYMQLTGKTPEDLFPALREPSAHA
jgi:hypothetical protein